jgi:hypothetical protein
MAQAKGVVESSMRQIAGAVNVAKGALAGLGVSVGVGIFANMIRETIAMEAGLIRLAQKTGSTVEAISSLSGAAKRSSTDLEDVAKGLQKLSKSMAEIGEKDSKAGKVFETLGISVTDATGKLRPAQEVMQELGGKLVSMKDQTLAVAFAQETMGKAGANLLPFLTELAQQGALIPKIFTDQAKAAKEFEDNVKTLEASGRAFKVMLANELLPMLIDTTQAMIDAKKAGEGMFAAAYRGAQTALTGSDMVKAGNEMTELTERRLQIEKKIEQIREEARLGVPAMPGASLKDWQRELDAVIDRYKVVAGYFSMLETEQEKRKPKDIAQTLDVVNPLGDKKDKDPRNDYRALMTGLTAREAVLEAEVSATRKLTESEKEIIKVRAEVDAGLKNLTAGELKSVEAKLKSVGVLAEELRLKEEWKKLQLEIFQSSKQFLDQQEKSIETMVTENTRQREQNEEIGKTTEQVNALRLARMDELIVKAERDQLAQRAGGAEDIEIANLQREIDLLKERRALLSQGQFAQGVADAAKANEEAFKRTANQIDTALTTSIANGLMHGFKKGDGIVKNFITMLQDAFKSAVLTPVIRAVVAPVSGAIAGMLPNYAGASSFAGAAGGAGGGSSFGGVGNLLSMGNTAYGAFSPSSGPLGAAIAGYNSAAAGYTTAASAGVIEAGSVAGGIAAEGGGIMAGIGGAASAGLAAIPVAGWVALAAIAAYALLSGGKKRGPKPSQIGLFGDPGGSFNIGQNDTPGGWANLPLYQSVSAAFNDPKQYDQQKLNALKGSWIQGEPNESADKMVQRLLAYLEPARAAAAATLQITTAVEAMREAIKAAQDPAAYWSAQVARLGTDLGSSAHTVEEWREAFLKAMEGTLDAAQLAKWQQFGNAVSQGQTLGAQQKAQQMALDAQQLSKFQGAGVLASTIKGYVDNMAVSGFLSPTARLEGARGLFNSTLAAARGGNLEAAGNVGGLAQTLLGAGRDVYASGPQFQALFTEVNRDLQRVLQQQGEAQQSLLAEMPASIREAANDTIVELKKLREEVRAGLEALNGGLRQFNAGGA